jgi:DNA-binding XRE family transcriptional regulator
MQETAIDLSDPLVSLRKALGLTQGGVAKALGLSQSTYAASEGRGGDVKLSRLVKLAAAHGLLVEVRAVPMPLVAPEEAASSPDAERLRAVMGERSHGAVAREAGCDRTAVSHVLGVRKAPLAGTLLAWVEGAETARKAAP